MMGKKYINPDSNTFSRLSEAIITADFRTWCRYGGIEKYTELHATLCLDFPIMRLVAHTPTEAAAYWKRHTQALPSVEEIAAMLPACRDPNEIVNDFADAYFWNEQLADIDALDTLGLPFDAPQWKRGDKVQWYHRATKTWFPADVHSYIAVDGTYSITITYPSGKRRGTDAKPGDLRPIQ